MAFEYVPGIPLIHPYVDETNRGYWESLKAHILSVQRCQNCGHRSHPPRPMCPRCLSTEMGWTPAATTGVVHTWVTFSSPRSAYPGIKCPYAVAVIELADGMRIVSNIVEMDPADIYIGMPVEAVFMDIDQELSLVHFRRREG
jgi:uncharacterized protein